MNVDTSRDATLERDADGKTTDLQQWILDTIGTRRSTGATVVELRRRTVEHHGRISGALSALHKTGRLAALRERRGNAGVYVLPEHVEGREVRPFRPNRASSQVDPERVMGVILHHRLIEGQIGRPRRCACGDWEASNADPSHNYHLAHAIAAALA